MLASLDGRYEPQIPGDGKVYRVPRMFHHPLGQKVEPGVSQRMIGFRKGRGDGMDKEGSNTITKSVVPRAIDNTLAASRRDEV
jgi:hypothetical protein